MYHAFREYFVEFSKSKVEFETMQNVTDPTAEARKLHIRKKERYEKELLNYIYYHNGLKWNHIVVLHAVFWLLFRNMRFAQF